ncbi:MAG: hypothetical protein RL701_2386 [Pseudomonadota bacterium]
MRSVGDGHAGRARARTRTWPRVSAARSGVAGLRTVAAVRCRHLPAIATVRCRRLSAATAVVCAGVGLAHACVAILRGGVRRPTRPSTQTEPYYAACATDSSHAVSSSGDEHDHVDADERAQTLRGSWLYGATRTERLRQSASTASAARGMRPWFEPTDLEFEEPGGLADVCPFAQAHSVFVAESARMARRRQ